MEGWPNVKHARRFTCRLIISARKCVENVVNADKPPNTRRFRRAGVTITQKNAGHNGKFSKLLKMEPCTDPTLVASVSNQARSKPITRITPSPWT